MNKGIKIVCRCDYDEVVEAAYVGYDEGEYDSFAFVGNLGAIEKILAVLLNDYDMALTSVHIDTVEYGDNMYQLTIDENDLITIAPVLEYSDDDIRKGYVLIEGIGKWFVDDSASSRFVRTLEKGGYNFEVFEVDGADCDDETVAYADNLDCEYCDGCDELAGDATDDCNGATFTIKVKPELDAKEFEAMVDRLEGMLKRFNGFFDWF